MNGRAQLKQYFGYEEYRPGQEEIVSQILSGRDVLCIMPTGAGKSVCYQIPALLMDGVALVISPLVSLMKDQVTHLVNSGVKAAYLNSTLSPAQMSLAMQRAREGWYKIIYVAPERLSAPDFLDFAMAAKISVVTVDEAHCVSQWGHDFRTSYLQIPTFVESLPSRPTVAAFTATATENVRADIMQLLNLNDPFVEVTGFDRKNLYFSVVKPKAKLDTLLAFIAGKSEESSIIYCATRKNVESVCQTLLESGYSATRYHAGLSPEERHQNQEDFVFERSRIMVATNAFGMGIDKSNVRNVVHYNMPKNLESYYQEAGRAGRDGGPATCLLLYSPQDVQTNRYLIQHSDEEKELIDPSMQAAITANNLELLRQMTFYSTTHGCLRHFILDYFGENSPLSCGSCGNCDTHFEEVNITAQAKAILTCVNALIAMRRPLGKSMVTAILGGGRERRVQEMGLDRLPSHGALQADSRQRIQSYIDHLVEDGYLIFSQGEYPVLLTTDKAAAVIDGTEHVIVSMPPETEQAPKKQKDAKLTGDGLYKKLRALRQKIANEQNVPAYIIFNDASLMDMCFRKPKTLEEFSQVSGVGQTRLQKYGERFIEVIREEAEGKPKRKSFMGGFLRKEQGAEAGKPWTDQEDQDLRDAYEEGLSVDQLSILHRRSEGAIRSRLRKLGLRE